MITLGLRNGWKLDLLGRRLHVSIAGQPLDRRQRGDVVRGSGINAHRWTVLARSPIGCEATFEWRAGSSSSPIWHVSVWGHR